MKNELHILGLTCMTVVMALGQEAPARHEVGLTLGGLLSTTRSAGSTRLDLGSGVALQANYGYRFFGGRTAGLYGEIHMLASPLRDVSSAVQTATRDVATLFVTPGVRLKFLPARAIAPYVAVGGGWADYQQSTTTLAGGANPAPRTVNHGVFDYGGGVDFKFWRFVGLRAEIRDFYAGAPAYNAAAISGRQHNVVAGGGLVLKFR
jgi:outer membrane protein with beta-barrel domain